MSDSPVAHPHVGPPSPFPHTIHTNTYTPSYTTHNSPTRASISLLHAMASLLYKQIRPFPIVTAWVAHRREGGICAMVGIMCVCVCAVLCFRMLSIHHSTPKSSVHMMYVYTFIYPMTGPRFVFARACLSIYIYIMAICVDLGWFLGVTLPRKRQRHLGQWYSVTHHYIGRKYNRDILF